MALVVCKSCIMHEMWSLAMDGIWDFEIPLSMILEEWSSACLRSNNRGCRRFGILVSYVYLCRRVFTQWHPER